MLMTGPRLEFPLVISYPFFICQSVCALFLAAKRTMNDPWPMSSSLFLFFLFVSSYYFPPFSSLPFFPLSFSPLSIRPFTPFQPTRTSYPQTNKRPYSFLSTLHSFTHRLPPAWPLPSFHSFPSLSVYASTLHRHFRPFTFLLFTLQDHPPCTPTPKKL